MVPICLTLPNLLRFLLVHALNHACTNASVNHNNNNNNNNNIIIIIMYDLKLITYL
jgi:hypothetical protein